MILEPDGPGTFPAMLQLSNCDIFESATNEMLNVTPNKLNLYLLYEIYSMVARKKN